MSGSKKKSGWYKKLLLVKGRKVSNGRLLTKSGNSVVKFETTRFGETKTFCITYTVLTWRRFTSAFRLKPECWLSTILFGILRELQRYGDTEAMVDEQVKTQMALFGRECG